MVFTSQAVHYFEAPQHTALIILVDRKLSFFHKKGAPYFNPSGDPSVHL